MCIHFSNFNFLVVHRINFCWFFSLSIASYLSHMGHGWRRWLTHSSQLLMTDDWLSIVELCWRWPIKQQQRNRFYFNFWFFLFLYETLQHNVMCLNISLSFCAVKEVNLVQYSMWNTLIFSLSCWAESAVDDWRLWRNEMALMSTPGSSRSASLTRLELLSCNSPKAVLIYFTFLHFYND